MKTIELSLPVRDVFVTQDFGKNYLDFYKKLGMKGHNGIDFRTKRGCKIYASHDGKVRYAGKDSGGGIGVEILDPRQKIKTLNYHLLTTEIKTDQLVKRGQEIGRADNTGKYTTGDHDHFHLKEIDAHGNTRNYDNGYKGAINPAPHFMMNYDGTLLNNKNWDKSRAYHRYGRPRVWIAEFWFRFTPKNIKNRWTEGGRYAQRTMQRMGFASPILSGEQVNAIIYGGWDLATVLNPSMYHSTWGWTSKTEYMSGRRPFLK
jgi:murein DD-endopeptidase MepM/ murein hydrolase activator NlpD